MKIRPTKSLASFALSATAVALLSACSTSPSAVSAADSNALDRSYTMSSGGTLSADQQGITIVDADIALKVMPEQRAVSGTTVLTLKTDRQRSKLVVDLDDLFQLDGVTVNGEALPTGQFTHQQGQVTASLPQSIAAGDTVKLGISYHGVPHVAEKAPWDGGFVWSHTEDGKPWIATAVQGEGCDLIWPCIDHPMAEPQSATIRVTVPKGLVAASNGMLQDVVQDGDWSRYIWHTDEPINTYAIALNIGPYKTLKSTYHSRYGNDYPMVFYYLEGNEAKAKELYKEFPEMLNFFEDMIGPYPFHAEKMGVVETPHLGMEHQTINAYGNGYKKGPYGYDWLMQHELAHEWFGNQITNTDWDHMWLHEGFGSYMQPLYSEYLHGKMAYDAEMYKLRQGLINEYPLVSNHSMTEDDVYQNGRGPGSDIYAKGAWVLHTLRQLIGDQAFFAATKQLVYDRDDPKPGNFKPYFADSQRFIDAVNEETGKNYQWFFDTYLYQAALPKLVTERDGKQLTVYWQTESSSPFPMPVNIRIDGKVVRVNANKQPQTIMLPDSRSHVTADPDFAVLQQREYIEEFADYRNKTSQQ
ncbi:peptidase M1 [Idiomarina tyrosinivorans]|uniref:Aminopeptidase N n=1 Tax=Idiomarina tyrosinivorans TaxID=1445662 RepID=A0A432ZTU9_9GAMM|nr:M1 family metallopeptidase [Idiomarina tyrosinivorans]RUO81364.1 peptidase M1 [Idiomarina tyrosinivorans]